MLQGVLAPVVGLAVDRLGPRRVLLAGGLLLGASSLLMATLRAPWQLYLYTGVLGAAGLVGVGWVPMGVVLAQAVRERRGRTTGLAFSGMGVGVFVVGPLAQALIDALGWRLASATLGAGALALLVPAALLVRPAPAPGRRAADPDGARGAGPTLRAALRTRAFWALFAAYFATPLAVFPVFTHQVAFAVDLGFPRLLVATVFGTMGLVSSVGRLVFGALADRIGGPMAATLSFACTAAGAAALVALEAWPTTAWLAAYAVLFGLGFGARGPIITAMATERFGGPRFGAIYGVLNLANGLGAALGPWFAGAVHDALGSYRLAFVAAIAFAGLGAACFWVAGRPSP